MHIRRCEDCEADISDRGAKARLCVDCVAERNRVRARERMRRVLDDPEANARRNARRGDRAEEHRLRRERRRTDPEYRQREIERSRRYRKTTGYRSNRRRKSKARSALLAILKRDGFDCAICGGPLEIENPTDMHVDHVVPISKGGSDDLENLQAVHAVCNLRKYDKPNPD